MKDMCICMGVRLCLHLRLCLLSVVVVPMLLVLQLLHPFHLCLQKIGGIDFMRTVSQMHTTSWMMVQKMVRKNKHGRNKLPTYSLFRHLMRT